MNIVLIGDCQTGKTSFIRRLLENEYCESYIATIAKELNVYIYKEQVIYIHDCSGLERYNDINELYYEKASGFIIMYTKKYPSYWVNKIPKNIPYICVQNKSDTFKGGKIQISCKNNTNIKKPIEILFPKMEAPEPFTWYSIWEYLLSFIKFWPIYYI